MPESADGRSSHLVAVASAVPPHEFKQRDVAAAAHHSFAERYPDFQRLARVFETSVIDRRYAVKPLDWYFQPLGWPERSAAYLGGAIGLALIDTVIYSRSPTHGTAIMERSQAGDVETAKFIGVPLELIAARPPGPLDAQAEALLTPLVEKAALVQSQRSLGAGRGPGDRSLGLRSLRPKSADWRIHSGLGTFLSA
ncbi:hypothetical protein [Bosea sp. 685]|uniref:hypothetical protein n=1 Tax=Bosea sp. 685 TaxID=3080057 RepID=UPI0028936347|nr:hypothetical protein [Bosea sp. 685]WNJ93510.1 hypothetical protein RMR04_14970 [Bosea sp. 685]